MGRPMIGGIAGCIACNLLVVVPPSLAGSNGVEGERPNHSIVFQLDNDVFFGSDQDYTNGVRFAYLNEFDDPDEIHNLLVNTLYNLSGVDNKSDFLQRFQIPESGEFRYAYGMGITQLMFTPNDDTALTAPKGERPYAGWLGLEFSLHVKNDDHVSSATLAVGTVGPDAYAEDVQDYVHKHISGDPLFQGWDSQVPNEVTVNLFLDRKNRISQLDCFNQLPVQLDGYYEYGLALGNFRTNAYVGALVRAGFNLPASYAIPRVELGSYGHTLFRDDRIDRHWFSFYTFGAIRGTAVMHDITLDGPVFREGDTGVDPEPFVGSFVYGMGLGLTRNMELTYSRTLRTDEFKGQSENHDFGSIALRFSWDF